MYISIGLYGLSSLHSLCHSLIVSLSSSFTVLHLHWFQQSLQSSWSPSVYNCLSYFFFTCVHIHWSPKSPQSPRPLLIPSLSFILLPLLMYISIGLHSLSSLLGLPQSTTVSRIFSLIVCISTGLYIDCRLRETKETGEIVKTNGYVKDDV